jgi:uncharacterized membrane protein
VTSVPLHPALVHIPLGLAFVIPILAIGLSWAFWKGRLRPRLWLILVLSLGALLAAGLLALKTGQQEGERIENVVPETAIETHEEYAEQFLWVTGITLVLAAGVLAVRRPAAVRALTFATVFGSLAITAMAIRVGHAGGELVYVHNAGAAYSPGAKAAEQTKAEAKYEQMKQGAAAEKDAD